MKLGSKVASDIDIVIVYWAGLGQRDVMVNGEWKEYLISNYFQQVMNVKGKVYSYPENFRALKILVCAKYGGHDVELDQDFQFGVTNSSKVC